MAGLPLFYFELSLGQFASLGPITIWKIVPLFRGEYIITRNKVFEDVPTRARYMKYDFNYR